MVEKILDYVRISLYILLAVVGFVLFQAWEQDHPAALSPVHQDTTVMSDHVVPNVVDAPTTHTPPAPSTPLPSSPLVYVTTDVLAVTIDTRGGDIVTAKLLKFPESLGSKTPYLLLNDHQETRYIAESGLLSKEGPDTREQQGLFTTSRTNYTLAEGEHELVVTLSWKDQAGLIVHKHFTFTRHRYEVKVAYEVQNQSKASWTGHLYTQLIRTNVPTTNGQGLSNLATYFGAAISSPQKAFQKITFKEMQERDLNQVIPDGWAAMVQHYFVSAWIPAPATTSTYYSRVTSQGLYTIGMIGPALTVAPGRTGVAEAKLYTGPTLPDQLEKAAPGLQLTIDYGLFWFISVIIFWMMRQIHAVMGNWGWSIVFVTVIIKLLFYQLSAKSYRSMSAMKKLQPRIEVLKEQYGEDKQKFTQAILELYRREKVNPMSGLLPILIQIPVFIALYWVLVESIYLRQAPFILWIHDLSQHDPYYVLPVMMGLSMFLQQRLNPPPPDPLQAKIMMMVPIIFTVLFVHFPAGLMLYWFVNNVLSFLQQWLIMHRIEKESRPRQ